MTHRTIAYYGQEGTFAHLAARKRYGGSKASDFVPRHTVKDVFDFVAESPSNLGIVPIENSSGGQIKDTVDCLVENAHGSLFIQESLAVNVKLALMGKSKRNIKTIYSHFAPLHHCNAWLDVHFPGVKRQEVGNTAKAVQIASEEEGAAALGNRMAGEIYGLEVLEFPIEQDIVENVTQFFVLGQHESTAEKNARTSLVVTLPDKPGSLVDFLAPFRKEDINLTRIISRPVVGKPESYAFLVDIGGALSDSSVKRAMKSVRKVCSSIRSLGTYPVRKRYES
jgi:prephenate dehydratase